jgi:hypothetical protein
MSGLLRKENDCNIEYITMKKELKLLTEENSFQAEQWRGVN